MKICQICGKEIKEEDSYSVNVQSKDYKGNIDSVTLEFQPLCWNCLKGVFGEMRRIRANLTKRS
jgi:hypothetical protein